MQEIFNNSIIKVEVSVSGEHYITALQAPGRPQVKIGATNQGLQISSPNSSVFNPTSFGNTNGFLLARTVIVQRQADNTLIGKEFNSEEKMEDFGLKGY